jgi:hypothetical protein
MYEFEYFKFFKCKFVWIESKISGLAEVESASFFLSPLIPNPLISPTESVRQSANFFLVSGLAIRGTHWRNAQLIIYIYINI